ncbi:MAG: hypothetical protein LBE80_10630 [Deltaproteobacteria bacterium]|nr:hypothetical protein [Deltaproteobacteria bacterium]
MKVIIIILSAICIEVGLLSLLVGIAYWSKKGAGLACLSSLSMVILGSQGLFMTLRSFSGASKNKRQKSDYY